MAVDLNTCVPEQQCIAGDGRCLTYVKKIHNALHYPHLLLDQDSAGKTFTNDGTYDICNLNGKYNIVRIIPMESTTSEKHPSIAWWESCPWITDRKPTKEDGDASGWVIIKAIDNFKVLTACWENVVAGQPWVHRLHWQPPVLSNKEQALELLNKHEGGWCPTPKEWTIIRKGLEE
jgi:hypothetical protein